MEHHRAASEPHKLTRNAKAKDFTDVSELSGASYLRAAALPAKRPAQTAEQVKTEQGQLVQSVASVAKEVISSSSMKTVLTITPVISQVS